MPKQKRITEIFSTRHLLKIEATGEPGIRFIVENINKESADMLEIAKRECLSSPDWRTYGYWQTARVNISKAYEAVPGMVTASPT